MTPSIPRGGTWGLCVCCQAHVPPGHQHTCGPRADDPRDTRERGRQPERTPEDEMAERDWYNDKRRNS